SRGSSRGTRSSHVIPAARSGPRRRVLVVLVVAALLLIAGAVAARGALWYQTTDFFCFYNGARSLVLAHDPYDLAWWATLTGGLYPDPWRGPSPSSCPTQYGYPLWTGMLMLPLGLLPVEAAAVLWMAISIGGVVLGAWALWHAYGGARPSAALFTALIVTSQPLWILLISGQMSGVMLGLLGMLALSLARGRQMRAGAALALLAIKPQIVVLTLPVTLLRLAIERRQRAVAATIGVGVLLLMIPMVLLPAWPVEWLVDVGRRRLQVVTLLPTAWGFAADLFGNALWGVPLAAALIAVCAALMARRMDTLSLLALLTSLSLVVTPYAWSYDFLVLACPWAFVLGRVARTRGAPALALRLGLVAVASILPWLLYAVAFGRGGETLSMIVPAATALLVAAATRMSVTTAGKGYTVSPLPSTRVPTL
ncbi:MAG: glycosyltransferase 87 family protein, partial [Chloroflexota bacterium]|nr:glycosyltransferase 87 family protein [Chloroflexota bacterium]